MIGRNTTLADFDISHSLDFPFETFLMALIEHSSRVRVQVSEMYSLGSHQNDAHLLAILGAYLVLVMFKTVACLLLFRTKWDNIHERLDLWSLLKLPWAKHDKRNATVKDDNLEDSDSRQVAIRLNRVWKQVPHTQSSGLEDVSLVAMYNQITVVHSNDEFRSLTVLCQMCAGFYKPDSGVVTRLGLRQKHARIAYIITVCAANL